MDSPYCRSYHDEDNCLFTTSIEADSDYQAREKVLKKYLPKNHYEMQRQSNQFPQIYEIKML